MKADELLVNTLTQAPATDANYKPALERATEEQLNKALEIVRNRPGNKGRITALERELRRRSKCTVNGK